MTELAQLERRVTRLEERMDEVHRIASVKAEMRDGFNKLAEGQPRIANLLAWHLGEPDEETRASAADE